MTPSQIEIYLGYSSLDISHLKSTMEELAGQWNGDEPEGEDKAMCASEIVAKCAELEALLDEMASYV